MILSTRVVDAGGLSPHRKYSLKLSYPTFIFSPQQLESNRTAATLSRSRRNPIADSFFNRRNDPPPLVWNSNSTWTGEQNQWIQTKSRFTFNFYSITDT